MRLSEFKRCKCGEFVRVSAFADHYLRCQLLSGMAATRVTSVLDRKD